MKLHTKGWVTLNLVKSVQNGVADFNYLLLQKFNRFVSKVINVMVCL